MPFSKRSAAAVVLLAAAMLGSAPDAGAQGTEATMSIVREHMRVPGSDGGHVGTVDKVEGQSILLTRDDPSSGGQHHAIPNTWVAGVNGDVVTLNRPGNRARAEWQAVPRPGDDRPAAR